MGRLNGSDAPYGVIIAFVASDTSQGGRYAFLGRDQSTEVVSITNYGQIKAGARVVADSGSCFYA